MGKRGQTRIFAVSEFVHRKKMISTRITTRYTPSLLNKELADELFLHLKENVEWEDGIYSKKSNSITRKAKAVSLLKDEKLLPAVLLATETFGIPFAKIRGVYLNYY